MEQEHTTLRGALPQKIFTSANVEPKVIKSVIDEVNKITNANFHEGDLIGRVYEYFLQTFAVNAEKEEGEFYTPHCIVELISSLIEPFDGTLYDPACGSGGMFVQSITTWISTIPKKWHVSKVSCGCSSTKNAKAKKNCLPLSALSGTG